MMNNYEIPQDRSLVNETSKKQIESLDQLFETFKEQVHNPETRDLWPTWVYCTTKMFLSTWVKTLQSEYLESTYGYGKLQVYSFHPGYCQTDMTKDDPDEPPLTRFEGAATSIYIGYQLPFLVDNELQGGFFIDQKLDS